MQDAPAGIGSSRMLGRFVVMGLAVGQPRPVQTRPGQGRTRRFVPKDHAIHGFRGAVQVAGRMSWGGRAPVLGPIHLEVLIVMPRPKSKVWVKKEMLREPHLGKPDRGNVVKGIEDALKGIFWRDDCQVWSSRERKVIGAGDEKPRVVVEVWESGPGLN